MVIHDAAGEQHECTLRTAIALRTRHTHGGSEESSSISRELQLHCAMRWMAPSACPLLKRLRSRLSESDHRCACASVRMGRTCDADLEANASGVVAADANDVDRRAFS
jgi:hypothetical protein